MSERSARAFYCIFIQWFSRLPLGILRPFGRFLARLVYRSGQAKVFKNIQLNLNIAFPELAESECHALARLALTHEAMSYCEFFHIWGNSNADNLKLIHRVHGEALFHQAIQSPQGLVLVTPHFGTWEVMNAWFAQHTKMTIMYKPIKRAEIDAFVKDARSRNAAHLVPTDERGIREILKDLKAGGTTVILPDHSPDQGNDMTPYFGVPLYSSRLSAKLIQKTKAHSLLVYALRNAAGGFDLHIEDLAATFQHGDAAEATYQLHQRIEALIRKYPMHYHWSYKRFHAHPLLRGLYDLPMAEALERIADCKNTIAPPSQTTAIKSVHPV